MKLKAEFGVFGGSGFYKFLGTSEQVSVKTPYGETSSKLMLSQVERRKVVFIPRHGVRHEFPPHKIPYLANVFALKEAGCQRVIGPSAVGSLRPDVKPGDIVLCDQLVNFTSGRRDTFYDGPETTHVSTADPYCSQMRKIAVEVAEKSGISYHPKGTVVVIQGPRFSTRAESRFFRAQGWDVINMTQYPEAVLCRELEMCYLNISLATDYDSGLEGDPGVKPVSHEEVIRVFERNLGKLRSMVSDVVKSMPEERDCKCGKALSGARMKA